MLFRSAAGDKLHIIAYENGDVELRTSDGTEYMTARTMGFEELVFVHMHTAVTTATFVHSIPISQTDALITAIDGSENVTFVIKPIVIQEMGKKVKGKKMQIKTNNSTLGMKGGYSCFFVEDHGVYRAYQPPAGRVKAKPRHYQVVEDGTQLRQTFSTGPIQSILLKGSMGTLHFSDRMVFMTYGLGQDHMGQIGRAHV